MQQKMSESDLAAIFMEFFGDAAEIYKEVPMPGGGICDFVVKRAPVITAVEVKLSCNLEVIAQAHQKLGYANYVYIAVPYGKGRGFIENYCKEKGIGILYYIKGGSRGSSVEERLKPQLFRKIYKPKLEEYMKHSIAGSQGLRMTVFKVFVKELYEFLNKAGAQGNTYKEVFELMDNKYYKTLSSFKSNVYQWVRSGVIPHVKIVDGKLYLDKEGYTQYLVTMRKQFGHFFNY